MSRTSTLDLPAVYDYLLQVSLRDDPLLRELREETARDEAARMQISPEQGQLLALLVKLTGSRRIIEVGTYTGYSSLVMARALPRDGYLLCCDINQHWTDVARRYWERGGVAERIELQLAPASETLQSLLDRGQQRSFDLAFIDADKENYDTYYEQCLRLLRPNGLIVLDNMLWYGKVADPSVNDPDTNSIRQLNRKLKDDARIDLSLIPVADGIALARKR
ncbi:methyltransferase domain-containing protein [Proteobacteria bacterium 005FR1]|nr:methyltransferase domain-containing protein [Proteobacteria bacterium 005FR1]